MNSKYSFKDFNIVEVPRVKTTTYGQNYFNYTAAVLWKMTNFSKFKKTFTIMKWQ